MTAPPVGAPAVPPVDPSVLAALTALPLSRLAHFTPARNLRHILRDEAIRSTVDLEEDVRARFAATDLERWDRHPDKICCSFEYPNAYYLRKAREKTHALNYPDWVCLLLAKEAAAAAGTLFTPRNAAASDAGARSGVDALHACFAPSVRGQGGRLFARGSTHRSGCATDVQAEILVTGPIPLSLVRAIVVPSKAAAWEEYGRLDRIGAVPNIPWLLAPGMFNPNVVAAAVQSSAVLLETSWVPDLEDLA